MLQQINLYREKAHKKIILPFKQILAINIAAIAIFFVISIFMVYGYYRAAMELQKLQSKQESLNKGLESAQKKVPTEEEKEQMQKTLNNLLQLKAYRQKMYTTLTQLNYQDSQGLVVFLNAMAEQTVPDLWLTKFHLSNNGANITLEGVTLNSSSVPEYLQVLGENKIFSGKNFEKLQISLDPNTKQIKFVVGSAK